MNDILSFALGIAVRVFVASASRNNPRLEATIVGLWEGAALYQLSSDNTSSLTPFLSAAARFYLDWIVCRDLTKSFVTLLWAVVTRLACEAVNNGYSHGHDSNTKSESRVYDKRRSSVVEHVSDLLERQSRHHHRASSSSSSSSSSSTSTITHTSMERLLSSELSPLTIPSSNPITASSTPAPLVIRSPQLSTSSVRSSPPQIPFPSFENSTSSSPISVPPSVMRTIAGSTSTAVPTPAPSQSSPQILRLQIPSASAIGDATSSRQSAPATPILPMRIGPRASTMPQAGPSSIPEVEQIQPAPPLSVVIADETEFPIDQSIMRPGSSVIILSKEDEPSSPAVSQFHHSNFAGSDDTLRTYSEDSYVSSALGTDEGESVVSVAGKDALLNRAEIYRTQARDEFEKACRLKRERNKALRRQDTKKAFQLYSEMKKSNDYINLLNNKAARRIFMAHNQSHPDDTIDVHGLQREEAKLKTENAIDTLIRAGRSRLNVIVGKGLHSANGVPVLKRTIIEYLNEEYTQFGVQENPRNTGVLVVTFQT